MSKPIGLPLSPLVMAALLTAAPGLAHADSLHGIIVSHHGDKLVVRTGGADTAVTLTGATKVQAIVGLIGARREDHPASDLINGLAINVDTVQAGDETDAQTVTFKPDDLKTAQAVQAGVAEAKQHATDKQAENEQRLSEVGQFVQKDMTRVYFATGKTTIGAEGEQALQAIASKAAAMPGALLRVVGHTDSTGNAAANQRLSDQRASAVTAYLLRQCHVPTDKMVSAGGLGDTTPIEDNDTSEGQAKNRRTTVFILVSKAAESRTSSSGAAEPTP